MSTPIPVESIVNKIVLLRGEKVLLDSDLAELYDVETKQLKCYQILVAYLNKPLLSHANTLFFGKI